MKRWAALSLGLLFFACGEGGETTLERTEPVIGGSSPPAGLQSQGSLRNDVPAAWREVRDSDNHRRHLGANVACTECHKAAEYKKVEIAACDHCHTRPKEGIHAAFQKTSTGTNAYSLQACFPCHSFRSSKPATPSCVSCHTDPASKAPKLSMHADGKTCAACHHPHSEQILDQALCRTCHADKIAAHGKDADACARCHLPHHTKADAKQSCAKCHAKERPTVTAANMIKRHKGCTDCHAPHDKEKNGLVPCASCHEKIATALAQSGATESGEMHTCIGCHPPHQAQTPGKVGVRACPDCHASIVAAAQGTVHSAKATCIGCHKPHDFGLVENEKRCQGCHDVKPVQGHTDCLRCHSAGSHQPQIPQGLGLEDPRECKSCHPAVAHSAPKGHQDCLSCHDRHGQQKPDKTCQSCHEAKTKALHGNIEGGCRNCHRPHAPFEPAKPPACSSCHELAKLPGLHGLVPHQQCRSCHQPHAPPPADRQSCLSCHATKSDHFPDARRCAACHAFAAAAELPASGGF
ncbi:MAG: hypothetical protein U1E65_16430 [Myxococcota bacterium]